MNKDKLTTISDVDEEIDDPYIHTVSTEEFVETVERASEEENDDSITTNEYRLIYTKPHDNTVLMDR